LLERMDDMQDSLDIYHTDTSDTIPFEQVLKETGITL
jgi:hypothetical protein